MIRQISEDRRDSMLEDVEQFVLKRKMSDGHLLHDMDTFHVALVVCTDHCVYDHQIYSRHLLPAMFDDQQSSLALIHSVRLTRPLLAYVKQIPKDITDIEDELEDMDISIQDLFTDVDEYGNFQYVVFAQDFVKGSIREIHIPMYNYKYVLLRPTLKAEVELDAHVASCVFHEMKCSRIFRRRFLQFVLTRKCFRRRINDMDPDYTDSGISAVLDIPCLVDIHLTWPKQKIDYAWDYRIQGQVMKKSQLEENMAWLNTLGGGYAALGDYFIHHAVKAGQISIQQLAISVELGDPISAAKCRLFFAQSLLQCGYLRQCQRIIREQYKFARKERVQDEKLEAMCIAIWNRLKFIKSFRKNNKIIPDSPILHLQMLSSGCGIKRC